MKKVTIRTRKQVLIPSGYLVHALARAGRRYNCRNCGDRMFVRYESGLCPLCFNGRRPVRLQEDQNQVPDHLALAGILDDPAIEELVESIGECAGSE